MANSSNFVDKNHHISLENLSCISKIPDITKSKNCHDFLTWNHCVNSFRIFNNLTNNLGTSLTKTNSKQFANFEDSVLQYLRLSNLAFSFFLFNFLQTHILFLDFPDRIQRIDCQFSYCIHHFLKRRDSDDIKIMTEEYRCDNEKKTNEDCSPNVEIGHLLIVPAYVVCKCVA